MTGAESQSSAVASGSAITVGANSAKLADRRSRLVVCQCGVAPAHYTIDHAEITNPDERTF